MKLSKSKLALAKVINENGGWPERALWAVQDNCIAFFLGGKPEYKSGDRCWYSNSIDGAYVWTITCDEKVTNWHQTVLSREEYFHLYPTPDSDGWIERIKSAQQVDGFSVVDVRFRDGGAAFGPAHVFDWSVDGGEDDIISYRLHKPKVKPEFCESVMRSIPEPEAKPTIEQLAQDYRNKLYFANRKQQEADDARVAADVVLGKLERAGEEIGLLIGIHKDGSVVDYLGWNSWVAGDLVELVNHRGGMAKVGEIGPISKVVGGGDFYVDFPSQLGYSVEHSDVKFIRRP